MWRILTGNGRSAVWRGEPEMDVEVETTWEPGSSVVVRGFHLARFENRGTVLVARPAERLVYTELSSISRLPDEPSSYTTLDFTLRPTGDASTLMLVASGLPTLAILKHVELYWRGTMGIPKQHAEGSMISGGR